MPAELRSGSKKPGRGRGRGAGTSARGTNPTPRGRGGTASRGRANAAPGAGDARQASGDAVAVAEEEQAEPNPATLAAEPPAADMRGKEEGETDKDAPPGDEKGKDEDASTAPLPEKVTAPPPPPPRVVGRHRSLGVPHPIALIMRSCVCSAKSAALQSTSWSGSSGRVASGRFTWGGASPRPTPKTGQTPTMCESTPAVLATCIASFGACLIDTTLIVKRVTH